MKLPNVNPLFWIVILIHLVLVGLIVTDYFSPSTVKLIAIALLVSDVFTAVVNTYPSKENKGSLELKMEKEPWFNDPRDLEAWEKKQAEAKKK